MTEDADQLTDRQVELLLTMRGADLNAGNIRRSWTAKDMLDRGATGPVNSVGVVLKKLVDKKLMELTQRPSAKGKRKAKYRLTPAGRSKARRFA